MNSTKPSTTKTRRYTQVIQEGPMDSFCQEEFQDNHSNECDYDDVWHDQWQEDEYPDNLVADLSVPWWIALFPRL